MATKKQRRRREKLQRHEYEYVVETEEGEEVVDSPKGAVEATQTQQPKLVDRRGREVKPPSWNRVLKRGAIFAPIMALLVFWSGSELSTSAKVLNVVILVAIFLPFSYLIDSLLYRSFQKRARRDAGR
jgi:hypothetical protein